MKKEFFMLSICLFSFFTSNSTPNEEIGPEISKNFEVASFEGVSLSSSFDVSIEYGQQQQVTITGSEEFFEKLNVEVHNGVLFLGMKKGKHKKLNIKATIVIPYLNFGEVLGSGDMVIANFSNLADLKLHLSGSGNITATKELYIKNNLNLELTGSGDIQISGSALHSNISLIGSGTCKAAHFKTNSNLTKITGSGNVEINASKEVNIHLSGSGNLYYTGNPAIQQKVTGSGKVKSYS
jgi:hypothetical protein